MSETMAGEATAELLVSEILLARPSLPVGQADLAGVPRPSDESAGDASEPGYAWERLPRWLAEIEDAMKKSKQPIVTIDMCSSLPLYKQLLTNLEFKRSGERAGDLVGALYNTIPDEAQPSFIREVHHGGSTRRGVLAQTLKSVVQEVLFTLNSDDMADGDVAESRARLSNRIVDLLYEPATRYTVDLESKDIESRWQIKYGVETDEYSYAKQLAMARYRDADILRARERVHRLKRPSLAEKEMAQELAIVGYEDAAAYIRWQADVLAAMIAGNDRYRPARFLSMDIADPADIALSSQRTMPESTQKLQLFSHALRSLFDPNQHIRGDIMESLDVPDNSITLITCFDGWPFYTPSEEFSDTDESSNQFRREQFVDQAADVVHSWYRKLVSGGKIVIFPWAMQEETPSRSSLLDIVSERISMLIGHEVTETKFHTATLRNLMSETDRTIADSVSPIFKPGDTSTRGLIIQKPNSLLVKQHTKEYLSRLTLAYQISEMRDPTP